MSNVSVQVIDKIHATMFTSQPLFNVGKAKELMLKVANFGKTYKWQIMAAFITVSVIAGIVVCLNDHKSNK